MQTCLRVFKIINWTLSADVKLTDVAFIKDDLRVWGNIL